jgi:hypothetical protein
MWMWGMRMSKGDLTSPAVVAHLSSMDAASPTGDAASSARDIVASPKFRICDTTLYRIFS